MAKRSFGKLAFLSLQDERGSVQLFCDKKRLEETSPGAFEMITELIDVGDIIGVRGSVKRSDKGGVIHRPVAGANVDKGVITSAG